MAHNDDRFAIWSNFESKDAPHHCWWIEYFHFSTRTKVLSSFIKVCTQNNWQRWNLWGPSGALVVRNCSRSWKTTQNIIRLEKQVVKVGQADMEFVQNFTPLDFQVKNFTSSISPNFNSFSKKKHKKWVKMEKFTPLAKILHCCRHWWHGQIPPLCNFNA